MDTLVRKMNNKEKMNSRKELIRKDFIYVVATLVTLLLVISIVIANVQADPQDGDIVVVTFFDNETITSPGELLLDTTTKTNDAKPDSKETTSMSNTTSNTKNLKDVKNIKAKIITAKRVKTNKTKAKVKIQKVNKITGYQVKYSLDKKLKKYKIRTSTKRQITLKKLKSKKKYYARARVYVKNGKKKVYGKWSKRKVIK